ncbi:hypothetical protein COB21_05175 [Candidatus Aerophobetes bacterium]|uniref:Prokaryotic-type class I peptide chain release factors domain-containing protein n=1 Tax=Aerophobetes bacterium TaxID=2030807 RepID=A0A2A4WZE7_UNCAE|nr:MAG: hypothetical protein COB21_05175 [Candidatus Aerophobetes bacterium]
MTVSNEKVLLIKKKLLDLGIIFSKLTITNFIPSGKGGTKMQKTHSAVRVVCPHLDITVSCQKYREKETNLYTALCKLYSEAAKKLLGESTPQEKKMDKIRKAKKKRKARAKTKYDPPKT